MKNAIVRFASLYVFNVAVLLLIGLLMTNVRVGWDALWASVILTLAALFVKPALAAVFRRSAAKSSASRTRVGEKVVQYGLVYVVELIIWVLTVWLSGVSVAGFFWGYVLPPLGLLLGWVIYDQVDDRLHAKASEVYDTVQSRVQGSRSGSATPAPESPQTAAGRAELNDGLTPEQRRMLDEL
ncbi:hypothetical protein [Microbacterium aurantiacum]|uniref:hypothetical protein n=1 Tax=Microbacterium aurantiacum TaxID=162393 RepID=UPI000C7FD710|nr:hypothetical protein [Microbacterium aurantiacum]